MLSALVMVLVVLSGRHSGGCSTELVAVGAGVIACWKACFEIFRDRNQV